MPPGGLAMPRFQHGLRHAMLAVAIAATAGGLMVASTRSARLERGRLGAQASCHSCLNNIAIALFDYSELHGSFPPPFKADEQGKRKHSWRLILLPWMPPDYPQKWMYKSNYPWDSPENAGLSSQVPGFLRCPGERAENPNGSPYVMINDFSGADIRRLPEDAILVVESWGANRNWLDPHDRIDPSPRAAAERTGHPGGFGVILRSFKVVRVEDPGRIVKSGPYYVLGP